VNQNIPTILALCASLVVAAIGCSRKPDANTELEKAAKALEKAEPTQTAPPPPSQSAQPLQPAPTAAPAPAPAPAPAQQLNQAMAAYKAGHLEDAVTRLQKLRASSAVTAEQRIALNDAMAAVMTEIYSLAAKGDARAQQAVKQYEQMQTSRETRSP